MVQILKDKDKVKKKTGRPPNFTVEEKKKLCERIFDALINGNSLRKVCLQENLPPSTFVTWITEDENLSAQYARSKELRAEVLFNEMFDIADSTCEDDIFTENGNRVANSEWIARSRLRVDVRKWALSKMLPKKYGEKIEVENSGEVNHTTKLIIDDVSAIEAYKNLIK